MPLWQLSLIIHDRYAIHNIKILNIYIILLKIFQITKKFFYKFTISTQSIAKINLLNII
jgi:hypothetical protein